VSLFVFGRRTPDRAADARLSSRTRIAYDHLVRTRGRVLLFSAIFASGCVEQHPDYVEGADAGATSTSTGSGESASSAHPTTTHGDSTGDRASNASADEGSTTASTSGESDSGEASTDTDGVVCRPGFADCDRDPSNGCEADLSDPSHCGACSKSCTLTDGTELTCDQGQCTGTVLLTVFEDAYVLLDQPDANFGFHADIRADLSPHYRSFMKPQTLEPIPADATVLGAKLILHCFNVGDIVIVYEVLEPWSEGQVTWNTAPAVGNDVWGIIFPDADLLTVDITPAVEAWVSGASPHGIVLDPTGTDGSRYHSMQHTAAEERPVIEVEISY
jgi:hypothetical protein